ncbi:hypothetical protein M8C21_009850 [Ambrosia artemisiifolia]|uniref:Uncharacterized protein n=1 Tax=Ambrosia artemisiifolia TaxID=4212 RepID=A0AAD5BLF5_AMBAR|nr:hypothetical protein M8C21_009850 [Ambrosia artemisiifolia]
MRPSLMFTLLFISIFLYEAQGIRLEKLRIPASNHQELITKSSSSNQDDRSAMATKLSSGKTRKLMIKVISSGFTTTNDKNYKKDPKTNLKFARELVEKEETFSTTLESSKHAKTEDVSKRYPDVIDITGMDYSPAKRKPPIHN